MAEQTIDKLQVEVEASAKGTTAVFAKLEGQLATLQKALSAIDTSKLEAVGKATNSAKPKIDTSGISKAQRDIASSVAKIQQSLAGLGAYANAAMGGDKSAFHSYERGATRLQSTIDVLKSKFEQLGNTSIPTEAFQKLDREIENTKSQLDGLEAKLKKGTDSGGKALSSQEMAELKQAAQEASDKITELQNKQRTLANEGKATYDPFAPYKEALSQVDEKLQATTQKVREAYAAMNESPNMDSSSVENVEKAARGARTSLLELFGTSVKKALDGLWSMIKKIGSSLSGLNKNADGFFNKGFMRILKYGFGIRSIYVLFRRLRKAVTESFKELQNSGAFFEETRANIEALKNSLTILKYQFGAAFEPIFNAVAPALKVLMENLIAAMNTISAFMAKLTGRSTYSKAVLNMGALADNTGKAAKAQKELNKQLQGFDELNNLTTHDNNGGSGGSGSSDEVPGAVYVEESVDSVLGDFGKNLAEKIRQGDWRGVGSAISEKLAEQLESINWTEVKQKAANLGKNLAEFLNGLIDPRLFRDIGTTIGEAINTALTFFNEWGKGMDWENLGISLAEGFDAWVQAGNLALLGETLHTWIAGGLVAVTEFFENADFEELGKQIAEFIGNLDIPDLAGKLLKLAKAILLALADAIKGLWNNSDVTTKIGLAIVGIIGFAKLTGLAGVLGGLISSGLSGSTITASAAGASLKLTGLKAITGLALTVGGTIIPAFSLGDNTLEDIVFDLFGGVGTYAGLRLLGVSPSMAIKITLAKVTWDVAFDLGRSLFAALSDAFGDSELAEYYRNFSWADFFPDLFEAAKTGNLSKGVRSMFTGPADSIGKAASEYGTANPDALEKAKEFRQVVDEIKESLRNPFGDASASDWGTSMLSAWNSFTEGASKANTESKSFKETVSSFAKTFEDSYNKSTSAWSGLGTWAKTKSKDMTNGFNNVTKDVPSKFGTAYTSSTSKWNNIGTWATNVASTTSKNMDSLPSDVSQRFGDAYTQGTSKWNDLATWAKGRSTITSGAFDTFPTTASKQFGDAYSQGTSKWGGLGTWATTTFAKVSTASDTNLSKIPTQFQTNFQTGTNKAESLVDTFKSWLDRQNLIKEAGIKADESKFTTVKNKISEIATKLAGIKSTTISVTASGFEAVGNKVKSLVNDIKSLSSAKSTANLGASVGLKLFASGGVVGGATPAIVGEAGPEAVIPLTDGTLGKLANMIVGDMVTPSAPIMASSTVSSYSGISANQLDMAEQNRLLKEQNDLLRQIANKNYTISTKEVFDATRSEANNYYNRTGNSAFLF